MTAAQRMPLL
jgi:Protein of unknown function (DUF1264)